MSVLPPFLFPTEVVSPIDRIKDGCRHWVGKVKLGVSTCGCKKTSGLIEASHAHIAQELFAICHICDARTGLEEKYVLPDWLVGGSWRLHVVCIFTVAWRVIAKCL